jgi:hypothetical protein
VRSTTYRKVPRPLPCGVRGETTTAMIPCALSRAWRPRAQKARWPWTTRACVARTPAAPADGRQGGDHGFELVDIVDICGGQVREEGDAARVRDEVVLRAFLAAISDHADPGGRGAAARPAGDSQRLELTRRTLHERYLVWFGLVTCKCLEAHASGRPQGPSTAPQQMALSSRTVMTIWAVLGVIWLVL